MFVLLPRKQFAGYQPPSPTLPRPRDHHQEWIDACRGEGKTPAPTSATPSVLTESLLLGNVALRTGKPDRLGRGEHEGEGLPGSRPVHQAGVPQGVDAVSGRRSAPRPSGVNRKLRPDVPNSWATVFRLRPGLSP